MNVLWVPHAPWRTPQRARLFAEELARRHTLHVTNYDAGFTRPTDFLSRRYLRNFFPGQWASADITVHHVPRVSPALYSRRLRQLNRRLFAQLLARLIRQHRIDVVVGTFVAPVPEGVPTVADIFDDNAGFWQSYGPNQGYAHEIAQAEGEWIGRSMRVVTVSSVLAEAVQAQAPAARVVHIPNPVDLTRNRPGRAAARRALGLDPAATYVGAVGALDQPHEARRLLAVAEALRAHPSVQLLIAGRGAARPWLEREAARRGLTNLRSLGFLSGDALLQHVQALDVGLCPYAGASAGDHARVPMRLLHYSAVGARVVCTRLTEVERMGFGNVRLTADTDADFAQGVLAALDEPGEVPPQLLAYDQAHLGRAYEAVLEAAVQSADVRSAAQPGGPA